MGGGRAPCGKAGGGISPDHGRLVGACGIALGGGGVPGLAVCGSWLHESWPWGMRGVSRCRYRRRAAARTDFRAWGARAGRVHESCAMLITNTLPPPHSFLNDPGGSGRSRQAFSDPEIKHAGFAV